MDKVLSALHGRTVFVSGGTRGIGLSIAQSMASEGANVIVSGRDVSNARTISTELPVISEFQRHYGVSCDLRAPESITNAVSEITEKYSAIDVLVNNAGITQNQLFLRLNLQSLTDVLQTNLVGSLLLTKAISTGMIKQKSGSIIFVGSVVGLTGNHGQTAYAASKAGLIGAMKSIAKELSPRGITCNMVAPGFIETDMTKGLPDNIKQQTIANIPLGAFGDTKDVAEAVMFLAKSKYTTGQVLVVDGGLSL